jgi:hypothetical protein
MMTLSLPARLALLVAAGAVWLVAGAPADAQRAHPARCDRVGTTAISFGRTAGNIKPTGVRIAANGVVRQLGAPSAAMPAPSMVPVADLRRLAQRAWTGPFVRLPAAPTRPTPNPDAARDFIELRSACGAKHVEYQSGTGAPEFRRLLAQLDTLTRVR